LGKEGGHDKSRKRGEGKIGRGGFDPISNFYESVLSMGERRGAEKGTDQKPSKLGQITGSFFEQGKRGENAQVKGKKINTWTDTGREGI